MFVVRAEGGDAPAQRLVASWPGEAGLLTCRDLSRPGWRFPAGPERGRAGGDGGTAVIGGRSVPAAALAGVLVRLPCAFERELGVIAAGDRSYVASEMTAFLSAWLSDLSCPVFNRPSPVHLMGPSWSEEGWRWAAARLGIRTTPALEPPILTVTVVGGCVVAGSDEEADRAGVALAREARVSTLRAHFASLPDGPAFVAADYWIDVDDQAVSSALVDAVRGSAS